MGMTCTLYRATEVDIDRLIEEPSSLDSFLDSDDASAPRVKTVKVKGILGFIMRLFPITITETTEGSDEHTAGSQMDPDRMIDIDKAWHGLHFLFTGTAETGEEPACYFVRGGEDLDDDGYARALRPDAVRRFSAFLDGLSASELERRYDPVRMTELDIYPVTIWKRSSKDSPMSWLLDCFKGVKTFVNRVAAAGD